MTIEQALINILDYYGNDLFIQTYDLKELIIKELSKVEKRNPMSSTILRSVRRLRERGYIVKCVSRTKSIYHIYKE